MLRYCGLHSVVRACPISVTVIAALSLTQPRPIFDASPRSPSLHLRWTYSYNALPSSLITLQFMKEKLRLLQSMVIAVVGNGDQPRPKRSGQTGTVCGNED